MCHPQPVFGPDRVPQDGAYAAAAFAAARCLMLDLLARLIVDPDDSEAEGDLRAFLNVRAAAVRRARQELIAGLPRAVGPDGQVELELVPGAGLGDVR
jgi:hypothetical protein